MELHDSIDALKGVGPKKRKIFESNGIYTLEDLLYFLPRSFEDRRTVIRIADLREGAGALIEARILSSRSRPMERRKGHITVLRVSDDTGILNIFFFNGFYMSKVFHKGEKYVFYGKVTRGVKRLQMLSPEYCLSGSANDIRGILPVYPAIGRLSQKEIRKYQSEIRPLYDRVREWLPEEMLKKYNLAGLGYALVNSHFPGNGSKYLMAKYRLIFDEFFTMEAGLFYMKSDKRRKVPGAFIDAKCADEFIEGLPFELTQGQIDAWDSVAKDLSSHKAMNRLIEGDVGSGKTVLAEIAMFAAAKNGYQAVMMAPTELLAKQHYSTLLNDFSKYGLKVGLLCGSMKAADKKEVLEKLEKGEIDILTGTHSLIRSEVRFRNLGMVITDEQHRFGVIQRKTLTEKGESPNVMVMTATPIPRTLAVILYGDYDISQIRTMPKGRKPVKTIRCSGGDRGGIYDFVEKELQKKRQAYVVAPLIEESGKADILSAEELYTELKKRFGKYTVALVHGGMKKDEKDRVMEKFSEGKIDLLVSTIVIEVGINVQNASVIVIENSERFGLAELHQLRGRVGRSSFQSYCFLICYKESETSRERSRILCNSADGFEIAEKDLELRGPGEIFGTKQHGLPEMRYGDLIRHGEILNMAKAAAEEILDKDPSLSSEGCLPLKKRIMKMFGGIEALNL